MFHKTVLSLCLKTGRCSTQSHSMSCTLIIHRKHHPRNLPPHCPLLNYNSHDATVKRSQMTAVKALILLLLNILLYKSYFTVFPMATNYSDLFFSLFILHFSFHVVLAVEEKEKGLDKHTNVPHEILFYFLLFFFIFISKMPLDKINLKCDEVVW